MGNASHLRAFTGTLCGFLIGILAIAVWVLTFEPHGGPELSHYLFPLSAAILGYIYPNTSIPVAVWYGGALLQWIALGVLVDLLRSAFPRKA